MKLRAGSGGGNRQQKMKDESQKQVLEGEAAWKKWEAEEGIQVSYSYYHLRLPAKILPFHPVPFSSNHSKVV